MHHNGIFFQFSCTQKFSVCGSPFIVVYMFDKFRGGQPSYPPTNKCIFFWEIEKLLPDMIKPNACKPKPSSKGFSAAFCGYKEGR